MAVQPASGGCLVILTDNLIWRFVEFLNRYRIELEETHIIDRMRESWHVH